MGLPASMLPSPEQAATRAPPVLFPEQLRQREADSLSTVLGRKVVAMLKLERAGLTVPAWFIVPPTSDADPGVIDAALDRLFGDGPPAAVAVRASAAGGRGARFDFTGLLESRLQVRGVDAVQAAIIGVRQSAERARVRAYLQRLGVSDEGLRMAVLVQLMAYDQVSGIVYSEDPSDPSSTLIYAGYGLCEGVASGGVTADTIRVARDGPARDAEVTRRTRNKEERLVPDPVSGTRIEEVDKKLRKEEALTDAMARRVAAVARSVEGNEGAPQLLHFSCDGDQLTWLLARPVSTAAARGSDEGWLRIWDDRRIDDGLGGVIAPMSYSIGRHLMRTAHVSALRQCGVDTKGRRDKLRPLQELTGYIRGRMYYNTLERHRLISLLPGFSADSLRFEKLFGLSDVAAYRSTRADASPFVRVFVGRPGILRLRYLLWRSRLGIKRASRRFEKRFKAEYTALHRQDLVTCDADTLLAIYREADERLLRRYELPLLVEIELYAAFEELRHRAHAWAPEETARFRELQMLCGVGKIAAFTALKKAIELARRLHKRQEVAGTFLDESRSDEQLWRQLQRDPRLGEAAKELRDFVKRYGAYLSDQMRVERPSLSEDPTALIAALRAYMRYPGGAPSLDAMRQRVDELRLEGQGRLQATLGGTRWARLVSSARRVRRLLQLREGLRGTRSRLMGFYRDLIRGLGRHMVRAGAIDQVDEVFLLSSEELFGFVNGDANTTDYRALCKVRRTELKRYMAEETPPPFFLTRGPVQAAAPQAPDDGDGDDPMMSQWKGRKLTGICGCPGVVVSEARPLRRPHDAQRLQGGVLAIERADARWIALLPLASGLLVERGDVMSPAIVVARELGLPTLFGLSGLMQRLRDGDEIELDATQCWVRVVASNIAG